MPILTYQNLPLAERDRAWSASEAEKRVREWAGASEGPNAKYARAFLYHEAADEGGEPDDSAAEDFSEYKLPYADVIDGTLTAIPRALFAAAARLDQTDMPDADKESAETHIGKYYAKMRKQFGDPAMKAPWERSAPDAYERRSFVLDDVRVDKRGDGDAQRPVIRGHAAVFDSPTNIAGMFNERVMPGAFTDTIKTDDVRALFNHNPDIVLGRTKAGTLRLAEDSKGLSIEIDPPDTQAARDLMISMERGDIDQMSFAFRADVEEWAEADDGTVTRTLKQVTISDVSPVTYPAYKDTDVSVARSELRHFHELKEAAKEPEQEPRAPYEIENEIRALELESLL